MTKQIKRNILFSEETLDMDIPIESRQIPKQSLPHPVAAANIYGVFYGGPVQKKTTNFFRSVPPDTHPDDRMKLYSHEVLEDYIPDFQKSETKVSKRKLINIPTTENVRGQYSTSAKKKHDPPIRQFSHGHVKFPTPKNKSAFLKNNKPSRPTPTGTIIKNPLSLLSNLAAAADVVARRNKNEELLLCMNETLDDITFESKIKSTPEIKGQSKLKSKGKRKMQAETETKPRKKISKGKEEEKVIGCSRLKGPVKSSKPVKADFNTDILDENMHKKLLLSMALARDNPRLSKKSPRKGIIRDGFYWFKYPALDNILRDHMREYYDLSTTKRQSKDQQLFNNRLVYLIRREAVARGWEFDPKVFNDKKIRDRIRCFFKTHIQNAKKRLNTMLKNPRKKINQEVLEIHMDLVRASDRGEAQLKSVTSQSGNSTMKFKTSITTSLEQIQQLGSGVSPSSSKKFQTATISSEESDNSSSTISDGEGHISLNISSNYSKLETRKLETFDLDTRNAAEMLIFGFR